MRRHRHSNIRSSNRLIKGGAQGIGAATVEILYNKGAHVFFGDWDEQKGRQLEQELRSRTSDNGGSVSFRRVDVRNHDMQLALFDDAKRAHNRVDVAIQCAGLIEPAGWFEPEDLNLETVRKVCMPRAACLRAFRSGIC
jgi:NAD(P)-dependent dehydrogenase (short-subunit alcohol dehydrogenase family)